MKKIFFMLSIVFSTYLSADSYILSDTKASYGGYGGVNMHIMKTNKKDFSLVGGSGVFVFNKKYTLGGFGYSEFNKENYINYGGIRLGYIYTTSSIIDPFINLSFGFGNISKDIEDIKAKHNEKSKFSTIDIDVGIDFKMTKWFRISPYIGHTSTTFANNDLYLNDNYGGMTYGIYFNFGSWKSKTSEE